MRYPLSEIEIQKLVYFLVQVGQQLGRLKFKNSRMARTRASSATSLRNRFLLIAIYTGSSFEWGVSDGKIPRQLPVARW